MDLASLDKNLLGQALLEKLREQLAVATAAQKATHEGATHEESRPEGIKDMRSTETSYLARGQASRVIALMEAVALVEQLEPRAFPPEGPIGLTALVELENEDGAQRLYWMASAGGGIRLTLAGRSVTVVTPQSPLGRALVGRRVGDDIELSTPQGKRDAVVVAIA